MPNKSELEITRENLLLLSDVDGRIDRQTW